MKNSAKKYVAFLRGINVGGKVMLPMKELAVLCEKASLENVRTYINSGNVLFESELNEDALRTKIEAVLEKKMERKMDVVIRTPEELETILKKNPFPNENPSQVGVILFADPISKAAARELELAETSSPTKEKIACSKRETYIYYPVGMGQTKLKMPSSTRVGTARNINTITKLIALSAEAVKPAKAKKV